MRYLTTVSASVEHLLLCELFQHGGETEYGMFMSKIFTCSFPRYQTPHVWLLLPYRRFSVFRLVNILYLHFYPSIEQHLLYHIN